MTGQAQLTSGLLDRDGGLVPEADVNTMVMKKSLSPSLCQHHDLLRPRLTDALQV